MKCKYYIHFVFHLTLLFGVNENCFSAEQMSPGTLAKLKSNPQAEIYFKNSKAFIFSLVESDQEFKIRDSIFVGPQSEAKLEFARDFGGGIILLGPNTIVTLIQTGKRNDIPTIEIRQGTVKVLEAPENNKEIKIISSKVAARSSIENLVPNNADSSKLILLTHESKAVVFNSSLESSEVKVSNEDKLTINPVAIPLRQKVEPAPPPVVFDLAKIQNLDPQPLQEFIRFTTEAPAKPAVENTSPVIAPKSIARAKAKPKPQIKAKIVQVPTEPAAEPKPTEIKAVTTEPEVESTKPVPSVKSSNLASNWFAFAGFSNMNYTQTASPSIHELILSLRGAYRLSISENLDLGVSGEASALPLASSDGIKLRFYRSNINAGFTPLITSSWRLVIYPGMYFSTTKASGFIIGYSELYGAELSTLIERTFSSNSRLGLSLRVAPVLNSTSIELGNREVGLGATYSFPPNLKKRYFSIQSDFTSLEVTFNTIQVSSKVICLGAAYNW